MSKLPLLILAFLAIAVNLLGAWTIAGNAVFINDSRVSISVSPHTVSGSGWVELNLVSKAYTGNADVFFGFDTTILKPTKALFYSPLSWNETASYTCGASNWYNYTTNPKVFYCWHNYTNGTTALIFSHAFDSAVPPTAYWSELHSRDWVDVSGKFDSLDYSYGSMNKWFFIKDFPVVANASYKLQIFLKMVNWQSGNGKYWVAIKPSSLSFSDAVSQDKLYVLDPWWNASFLKCKTFALNTTVYDSIVRVNQPTEVNLTGLTFWGYAGDVRVVNSSCGNNGTEIGYTLVSNGSNWVDVLFEANGTPSAGINWSVYYDYPANLQNASLPIDYYEAFSDEFGGVAVNASKLGNSKAVLSVTGGSVSVTCVYPITLCGDGDALRTLTNFTGSSFKQQIRMNVTSTSNLVWISVLQQTTAWAAPYTALLANNVDFQLRTYNVAPENLFLTGEDTAYHVYWWTQNSSNVTGWIDRVYKGGMSSVNTYGIFKFGGNGGVGTSISAFDYIRTWSPDVNFYANELSATMYQEEFVSNVSITVYSPLSSVIYGYTNITGLFYAKSSTASTVWVRVWDNSSIVYDNSSVFNATNVTFFTTQPETARVLRFYVNDSSGTVLNSNVTFYVDVTPPNVTIKYPTSAPVVFNATSNTTLALNVSAVDVLSWVNCSYSFDGGANVSMGVGCVNATIPGNLSFGFHSFEVYAFDYVGNKNKASVSFWLDWKSDFRAQDTVLTWLTLFDVTFSNGSFSVNKVASNDTIFINASELPQGTVTATWNKAGYNTTRKYYFVNGSFVTSDYAVMAIAGLSVMVFNEKNISERLYFNSIANNGTCQVTNTSVWTLALSYLGICAGQNRLGLSNASYVDLTTNVTYSFPQRNYYAVLIGNTTVNVNGFLLRYDQGIYYAFVVSDYNNLPLSNVMVTASRYINGSYLPIEQEITDSTGTANFFLDFTNEYQVIVSAGGYVSLVFYLTPSTINRVTYVKLQSTGAPGAQLVNFTTVLNGVSMQIAPNQQYQNDSFTVQFIISDSQTALENFSMAVYFRNATGSYLLSSQTLFSASGATLLYITSNRSGYYDVYTQFKKSNYSLYVNPVKSYYITGGTGFAFQPGAFNLSWASTTLQLVAIMITIIVMIFFARFSVTGAAFIGLSVLGIFTFGLGFIPFSWFAITLVVFLSFMYLKLGV